jgi:hypothetical protein
MNILHRAGEIPEDLFDLLKDARFALGKIPRVIGAAENIHAALDESIRCDREALDAAIRLAMEVKLLIELLKEKREGGEGSGGGHLP